MLCFEKSVSLCLCLSLSLSPSLSFFRETKSQSDFYAWNTNREERAEQIIGNHLARRFPVLALPSSAAVPPAVGQALQTFAESVGAARCDPLRIYVANLSYMGSAVSGIHMDLCGQVGDLISQSPATSCAIIFHSNVLPPGVYCFWGLAAPVDPPARLVLREKALM